MVLAIGLLVDDAIVVAENVERVMMEYNPFLPREATEKSMSQIQERWLVPRWYCSRIIPMAFWRLDRGNLSPVLYYYCFSNGAIRSAALILTPASVRYAA